MRKEDYKSPALLLLQHGDAPIICTSNPGENETINYEKWDLDSKSW